MKKKVVPDLQQEVKVKVDIATSDDIKIYYTGKFQDFTARYIIHVNVIYIQMHFNICFVYCFGQLLLLKGYPSIFKITITIFQTGCIPTQIQASNDSFCTSRFIDACINIH